MGNEEGVVSNIEHRTSNVEVGKRPTSESAKRVD